MGISREQGSLGIGYHWGSGATGDWARLGIGYHWGLGITGGWASLGNQVSPGIGLVAMAWAITECTAAGTEHHQAAGSTEDRASPGTGLIRNWATPAIGWDQGLGITERIAPRTEHHRRQSITGQISPGIGQHQDRAAPCWRRGGAERSGGRSARGWRRAAPPPARAPGRGGPGAPGAGGGAGGRGGSVPAGARPLPSGG